MDYKEADRLIREGLNGKHRVSTGLYLNIRSGTVRFILRYSLGGKRKDYTLSARYPIESKSYKTKTSAINTAIAEAEELRSQIAVGVDPAIERKEKGQLAIHNCDDLFTDWYRNVLVKRLKHPHISKRLYDKELSPVFGDKAVARVTPRDVREVISRTLTSCRPTIANKSLDTARQLFNHAIKLGLIVSNPAGAFTVADAAGAQPARSRALTIAEIRKVFQVFRENIDAVQRPNYLAFGLLILLGCRKQELIQAEWRHIDLEKKLWSLPGEHTKTGSSIKIPLPIQAVEWLKELKVLSCGSSYVFPNRRASKRRGYISNDTLNHCLANLFGKSSVPSRVKDNVMGKAGIKHFVVHDLRRTCRTLLAGLEVSSHVAERCLNHKLQGVQGVYDRHDYLKERTDALNKLAELVVPAINGESNVIKLRSINANPQAHVQ